MFFIKGNSRIIGKRNVIMHENILMALLDMEGDHQPPPPGEDMATEVQGKTEGDLIAVHKASGIVE